MKVPVSIIGVLPEGFDFLASRNDDIFLPLEQTADLHVRVANGGLVLGRLANGASERKPRGLNWRGSTSALPSNIRRRIAMCVPRSAITRNPSPAMTECLSTGQCGRAPGSFC